jgi:cellulose synthase/poly-beta-1,6-N-acetylglucosamine synthase-like glycosyltransferase
MIWWLLFLFSSYALLIISLAVGFTRIDEFKGKDPKDETVFSVIIPFRNEAKNLANLLKSISELNYSKELVEFIFVDDASTDESVNIIQNFAPKLKITTQVIPNTRTSNSPKKDAIATAISIAKNTWIITTDADCIVPQNWLKKLNSYILEKDLKMVVAPVNYKAKNNFLSQFQWLDFMSMQGSTIGGFGVNFPFLCNGANLAYKKDTFIRLNGFEGNNTMASGDDIFLFEKFLTHDKKSVGLLKSKEAIVTTFPVKTWGELLHQRTRWAAKTSQLKSAPIKLIGLLVLLVNCFIVFSVFIAVFQPNTFTILLLAWSIKIIVDLVLFIPTIRFFNIETTFFKWYVPSSLIYPFFSVFVVLKTGCSQYKWKGRRFKK